MEYRYDNLTLQEALDECRKHGDDVSIGFTGGVVKLKREARRFGVSPNVYVQGRRLWKVHYADNRGDLILLGPPVLANWISGGTFRQLVGAQQ